MTITDSDTINITVDESASYFLNLGPPATSVRVTQLYNESLVNGNSTVYITQLYNESLVNGIPTAYITQLYWETLVSVRRATIIDNDVFNITVGETISRTFHDSDTINISITENNPSEVIDVHPNVIPINQPYVLLYVLGFGFLETAQIIFNGIPVPTTYVNINQLTAKILPTLIQPVGIINVNVINN